MKELFVKKTNWNIDEIDKMKYDMLLSILKVNTQESVEAAIKYVKFLNKVGINNNNYPTFLRIIGIKNKFVIDAMLGAYNPFSFLNNLQPDFFIISSLFGYLSKFQIEEIYHKTLKIILGYLQTTYETPVSGYKIYSPTKFDINNFSKHFNKENDENNDMVNKTILTFLEKISMLENENSDENMEDLAIHAHNIRNNFLDPTKKIDEILPEVLLKNDIIYKEEIEPGKFTLLSKTKKS